MTLSERLSSATADRQRECLESLYITLNGGRLFAPPATADFQASHKRWQTFSAMLDAEAYLDAAVMLVPEGYDWAVFRTNGGLTIHAWCGSREDVFGEAPALALCAAITKERGL